MGKKSFRPTEPTGLSGDGDETKAVTPPKKVKTDLKTLAKAKSEAIRRRATGKKGEVGEMVPRVEPFGSTLIAVESRREVTQPTTPNEKFQAAKLGSHISKLPIELQTTIGALVVG